MPACNFCCDVSDKVIVYCFISFILCIANFFFMQQNLLDCKCSAFVQRFDDHSLTPPISFTL